MGVSKRTRISHSTPEAEIVSADLSLGRCGLPNFAFWRTLLSATPKLMFLKGNQTMVRVAETGRNPATRYLARTHHVSVAWLSGTVSQQSTDLIYDIFAKMCADIYIKAFTEAAKWQAVCDLTNTVDLNRSQEFLMDFAADGGIHDN